MLSEMKFRVTRSFKHGRIGQIIYNRSAESDVIDTPFSVTTTRWGQVPHLTGSCIHSAEMSPPAVLQVPLNHQVALQSPLQTTGVDMRTLAGHKTEQMVYSCVLDPLSAAVRSGYNDKNSVSVWCKSQRHRLDTDSFMRVAGDSGADWLELMCDWDTDVDCSDKRRRKAVERTLSFVGACVRARATVPSLEKSWWLAPLIGGACADTRKQYARALLEEASARCDNSGDVECGSGFDGFVIHTPFSHRPDESMSLNEAQFDRVIELITASLSEVPTDGLRVLHGAWRPLHVLRAATVCGVDVFDSSYACWASERHAALVFPLDTAGADNDGSVGCHDNGGDKVCLDSAEKFGSNDTLASTVTSAYTLNLKDVRMAEDFRSLVCGCRCHTCRHFSRAYIHHLVNVKEMLAPLLLQIHNLHHWGRFFSAVRSALANDRVDQLISVYLRLEADSVL